MFNFLSTIAKGLFNTKIFFKEVRTQAILFISVFVITFCAYGTYTYQSYNELDKKTVTAVIKAELYNFIGFKHKIIDTSGTAINIKNQTASSIANRIETTKLLSEWKTPALIAALIWLFLAAFLFRQGRLNDKPHIDEGTELLSSSDHQSTNTLKKSDIKVGNVNIPLNSEVQHTIISGSPGSGKSQLLHQFITQIIGRNDIAIIIDPKGEFVVSHYREGIDKILCQFDQRTEEWSPNQDLKDEVAYETFANAIIEANHSDPFWPDSARAMLVEALRIGDSKGLSFKKTIQIINSSNLETLEKWFENSEMSSDFASDKTIAGILRQLKNKTRYFKYLPENSDGFSLNTWLANALSLGDGQCLFIPIPEYHKSSIAPIAGAQLELLATQILSLKEDRNRRIWIIVDELPSLPQLPMLQTLLAKGRSNGVAAVLAIQNYSQLKRVYGKDGADSFAGLCSNAICLRTSDPSTAKYFSERFGNQIKRELQKGKSHTKNSKNKSSSENENEHISDRATVSTTKLLFMNDLEGVIAFRGMKNPVEIRIDIQELEDKNESFIPKQQKNSLPMKVKNLTNASREI